MECQHLASTQFESIFLALDCFASASQEDLQIVNGHVHSSQRLTCEDGELKACFGLRQNEDAFT
eukprot:1821562-Amphidinium_carterae.1